MSIVRTGIRPQGIEAPTLGRRLLVAFIAATAVAAGAAAQPSGQQPKLLVGIVVDDLQNEYITLLRDNFGARGFNLLLDSAAVIPDADYGVPLDAAAATALLFTGASPAVNGVPAAEVFDRSTMRGVPVLADATAQGNYTSQAMSPAALAVTTIGDEARVAGGGVTYVYSIAPDPAQAIIMAGHAGNCGIWLNNANTNWSTSSYYGDTPSTLASRNRMSSLRARIDTIAWTPSRPKECYSLLPSHATMYPFKHTFRQSGPDKLLSFKNSPKINEEITDFAIDNINTLKLGQHGGTDMLGLSYTLQPYAYAKGADARYELFDSYYRLDHDLERLFAAIDKSVGLDNAVVFLAATPAAQRTRRDDDRWQLPYGEFSTKKTLSLLNLYLMAKFGNGDWATAYHNGQFFLNHKLIEEKKLDIELMRIETARFLERMSGVTSAYTIDEILDSASPEARALRNSVAVATAGDVFVQVQPGWQIIDDYNGHARTEKVERAVASTAPVFILAPGVAPQKINGHVDARSIAPTITRLLRIRSPNGASAPAIDLQ